MILYLLAKIKLVIFQQMLGLNHGWSMGQPE